MRLFLGAGLGAGLVGCRAGGDACTEERPCPDGESCALYEDSVEGTCVSPDCDWNGYGCVTGDTGTSARRG